MSRLIQMILGDSARQSAAAWHRYADLLEKDNPTDAEIEEVKAILLKIGRRPEDLEADRTIVLRLRRLQQLVHDGSGLDEQIQKARKAVLDDRAEVKRILNELQAKHHQLKVQSITLYRRQSLAESSTRELNAILTEHPQLLGHIPPIKTGSPAASPPAAPAQSPKTELDEPARTVSAVDDDDLDDPAIAEMAKGLGTAVDGQ